MNLNQSVITSNYIVGGSAILKVIRDEEGDWQFLNNEDINEENAVVLSLQQVLDIDITVRPTLSLGVSSFAFRLDKKSEWIMRKI